MKYDSPFIPCIINLRHRPYDYHAYLNILIGLIFKWYLARNLCIYVSHLYEWHNIFDTFVIIIIRWVLVITQTKHYINIYIMIERLVETAFKINNINMLQWWNNNDVLISSYSPMSNRICNLTKTYLFIIMSANLTSFSSKLLTFRIHSFRNQNVGLKKYASRTKFQLASTIFKCRLSLSFSLCAQLYICRVHIRSLRTLPIYTCDVDDLYTSSE